MIITEDRCSICGQVNLGVLVETITGNELIVCWHCIEDMLDAVNNLVQDYIQQDGIINLKKN